MRKNLLFLLLLGCANIMLPSTAMKCGTPSETEANNLVETYLTPLSVPKGTVAKDTIVSPLDIKPFFLALSDNNNLILPVINDIHGDANNLRRCLAETYGTNNIPASINQIIASASEVRKGALYNQVAKFVGRIEIRDGDGYTGTGTVVSWKGMPPALKGRVVITVFHNHPDDDGYDPIPASKTGIGGVYLSTKSHAPLGEYMWFTPDTDMNTFNVWPKGRPTRASIPVGKIYCFATPKGIKGSPVKKIRIEDTGDEFHIFDFAVIVLSESVPTDIRAGVDITTPEDFNDKECFLIGYGRPSNCPNISPGDIIEYGDKQKLFTGWNIKKKSFGSRTIRKDDETSRIGKDSGFGNPAFHTPYDPNSDTQSVGPSYSGSPIVTDSGGEQYKIIGVIAGGESTALTDVIDKVKAILNAEPS